MYTRRAWHVTNRCCRGARTRKRAKRKKRKKRKSMPGERVTRIATATTDTSGNTQLCHQTSEMASAPGTPCCMPHCCCCCCCIVLWRHNRYNNGGAHDAKYDTNGGTRRPNDDNRRHDNRNGRDCSPHRNGRACSPHRNGHREGGRTYGLDYGAHNPDKAVGYDTRCVSFGLFLHRSQLLFCPTHIVVWLNFLAALCIRRCASLTRKKQFASLTVCTVDVHCP